MLRGALVRECRGLMVEAGGAYATRHRMTRVPPSSRHGTGTEGWMLLLPVLDGPGPILSQEPAQRAVRQHFASGLAAWAVVDLVFCIADALHQRLADGAGLPETPVHGHARPKCGYLL